MLTGVGSALGPKSCLGTSWISHGKLRTRSFSAACKLYVLIIGQFSGQLRALFVCQSAEPGPPGGGRLHVILQASQWLWCQLKRAPLPCQDRVTDPEAFPKHAESCCMFSFRPNSIRLLSRRASSSWRPASRASSKVAARSPHGCGANTQISIAS